MLCRIQSGLTALYWAARKGYVNIVQMLINYGAAVDIRTKVTNINCVRLMGGEEGVASLPSAYHCQSRCCV